MEIKLANKNDSREIAVIHQQEINQGFLSQLGVKFLSKLYEAMVLSENCFVLVAKENNQIVGSISGCLNTKEFYREFLKKYGPGSVIILLSKILNLAILKKIFETLKYSKKIDKNCTEAELLTIACKKEFRGTGLSIDMFKNFVNEMESRGIKEFKVVVGEELPRAIGFYEKLGFKLCSNIIIHKGYSSRVYVYNVSNQ